MSRASTGQPVGPPVRFRRPAPFPGPVTLDGRYGTVERLSAARHRRGAVDGDARPRRHLDLYVRPGPFADFARVRRLYRASASSNKERIFYAVVEPSGRAVGILSLMEIRPAMRVIEVGNIVYSPALQRTPLATEAQYLIARYAFETLGYRRYEWKCNALNAPSHRAAVRFGFTLEACSAST